MPFGYQPDWGGYIFNEHPSYTGISATFTLPSSMPAVSAEHGARSVWVGLGNINQVGMYLGLQRLLRGQRLHLPVHVVDSRRRARSGTTTAYPAHGGDSLTLGVTLDGGVLAA